MKSLLISLIRIYQHGVSPLLGANCRYTPSCSEYFVQALKTRGLFMGAILGVWRVLRCNPFGGSGCDPVPEKRRKTKSKVTGHRSKFQSGVRSQQSGAKSK